MELSFNDPPLSLEETTFVISYCDEYLRKHDSNSTRASLEVRKHFNTIRHIDEHFQNYVHLVGVLSSHSTYSVMNVQLA